MTAAEIQDYEYKDPADVFAPLAGMNDSLLFDGVCPGHPLSRYSYICWNPVETLIAQNGQVTITGPHGQTVSLQNPFDVLHDRLAHYGVGHERNPHLPPFQGGAAGCFGYDLGRTLERLPAIAKDNPAMPNMMIGIYTNVIAFDHAARKAWTIGAKPPPQDTARPAAPLDWQPDWKPDCPDGEYRTKIEKIIAYIYAGEIYQVNLSRRFTARLPRDFNAFSHYMRLRHENGAPFSAFMNFGNIKLASCSPERFLNLSGRRVETRPIKGTLPASQNPDILLNSAKNRAENLMIVDLLRNDLSRVCDFGSVKVPRLCALEKFEGLYHLVSTVEGMLQDKKTATDLLKAAFPGGSITGAPKIRAMEIIEELEPNRRGPYCGALGMIGFDGNMDSAVTIRTLVYDGEQIHLQTGSGIVADSDPDEELQESLDKAQKIFESFDHDDAMAQRKIS